MNAFEKLSEEMGVRDTDGLRVARHFYFAGMRAAAEIVRTCAPPKSPEKNGPHWEIGRESRAAYAGAILAEADK